jgi:hypothetical protein
MKLFAIADVTALESVNGAPELDGVTVPTLMS